MVVGVTDDGYDDNYFRVQVDVLPATMQEQEYKKATDVSKTYTIITYCVVLVNYRTCTCALPSLEGFIMDKMLVLPTGFSVSLLSSLYGIQYTIPFTVTGFYKNTLHT